MSRDRSETHIVEQELAVLTNAHASLQIELVFALAPELTRYLHSGRLGARWTSGNALVGLSVQVVHGRSVVVTKADARVVPVCRNTSAEAR